LNPSSKEYEFRTARGVVKELATSVRWEEPVSPTRNKPRYTPLNGYNTPPIFGGLRDEIVKVRIR
jgi:hypothetical protein